MDEDLFIPKLALVTIIVGMILVLIGEKWDVYHISGLIASVGGGIVLMVYSLKNEPEREGTDLDDMHEAMERVADACLKVARVEVEITGTTLAYERLEHYMKKFVDESEERLEAIKDDMDPKRRERE